MKEVRGYVLRLSEDRIGVLKYTIEMTPYKFGEPVEDFKHSRNMPLVCFVLDHRNNVSHVALAGRGVRAGTNLRRLNLREVYDVATPLSSDRLLGALPKRFQKKAAKTFSVGGVLPPKTLIAVVDAARHIDPTLKPVLDKFSSERASLLKKLSQDRLRALAYQKEATATALNLAGLDRKSLQVWMPDDAEPGSYLEGLPQARLREDQIVSNDLRVVPGYELIKTMQYGAAVFRETSGMDPVRLTVVIANRLPLEEQFGTDLIYFNEKFHSFIMVQYKMMESSTHGAVFRIPSAQLDEEIRRMERVLKDIAKCPENATALGFRFLQNPFYLKFCPRLVFNPDDAGLSSGMYLPLDYWKILKAGEELRLTRGGLGLTFENAGRHLDNSQFTDLVSRGWIGTTAAQSDVLQEVIRTIIESGRAVCIAVKASVSEKA